MVIRGGIAPRDIAALCERVQVLLEAGDADGLVCDVAAVVVPDAVTVDALARLQLTARRSGQRIRLLHACGALVDLLGLVGLTEVLPTGEG